MNESFDPYLKWLGIPPRQQPPHHYRLLAIELFESDPDVIANAADARMAHVKTFATGKHSRLSQRLLNEISAARVCLLNPQQKVRYDESLRAQLDGPAAAPASALATPPAPPTLPTPGVPLAPPEPGMPLARGTLGINPNRPKLPPPDELVVYPTDADDRIATDGPLKLPFDPLRPRGGTRLRNDRHEADSEPRELSQLELATILAGVVVLLAVAWLGYRGMQKGTSPQRSVAAVRESGATSRLEAESREKPVAGAAGGSATSPDPKRSAGRKSPIASPAFVTHDAASNASAADLPHVHQPADPVPLQTASARQEVLPSRTLLSPSSKPEAETSQSKTKPGRSPSYALKFNGANSYVLVKEFGYTGGTGTARVPITVETIVQLPPGTSTGSARQVICGNGGTGQGLGIGREGDCWCFEFCYRGPNGPSAEMLMSKPATPDTKWVHVAGVFDGKAIRLYVDGHLEANHPVTGMHVASFAPFLIGAAPKPAPVPKRSVPAAKNLLPAARGVVAAQYGFVGLVREARISNTARYKTEFSVPMELTRDRYTKLLLRFVQGSGTEVEDSSPNKLVAEIHGAQWVNVNADE
jgi:hypothetical protein